MVTADVSDLLLSNIHKQEDNIFLMSATIKKLMFPSPSSPLTGSPGAQTPKIDIPTFDRELLQWQTFWEQFSIAVDKRSDISDTEKLVYLHHSLKDGSAKNIGRSFSLC